MKTSSLTVALLIACAAWPPFLLCQTSDEHNYSAPPVRNLKFNSQKPAIATTLNVLPGQEIRFHNDAFVWVRIFSDDPLMVEMGDCKGLRTKDITCVISGTTTVSLTDIRFGYPLDPELINHVHITALQGLPYDPKTYQPPTDVTAPPAAPAPAVEQQTAPAGIACTPVDQERLRSGNGDTRVITFPICAGQELRVGNFQFSSVMIESDFPVSVQIGACQFIKTQHANCSGVSANDPIRVWDLRTGTPPDGGADNRIKITASIHE